jgi:predicted DNA-binding transcriptional regulator YafY
MDKLSKILRLVMLLQSRRQVTATTIQRVCRIHARTMYRYINTISEADIPVYYDRPTRSYRLTSTSSPVLEGTTVGEGVMLAMGLQLLRAHVSQDYQTEIDPLLQKIVSHQTFPLEEVLPLSERDLSSSLRRSDLTTTLSWSLVQAAIVGRRRVTIKVGSPRPQELQIDEPHLRFRDEWSIQSRREPGHSATPLSRVRRVKVV